MSDFIIADQEIHLWCCDITDLQSIVEDCLQVLSIEEQQKAAKFLFNRDRKLYIYAHAFLRVLLAKYLNCRGKDIVFTAGFNNKPLLSNNAANKRLAFNLSHSFDKFLIACSVGIALGVDIETTHRPLHSQSLLNSVLCDAEKQYCSRLAADEQHQLFLQLWTRKEAAFKASGLGLSGKFRDLNVLPTVAEQSCNWLQWQQVDHRITLKSVTALANSVSAIASMQPMKHCCVLPIDNARAHDLLASN